MIPDARTMILLQAHETAIGQKRPFKSHHVNRDKGPLCGCRMHLVSPTVRLLLLRKSLQQGRCELEIVAASQTTRIDLAVQSLAGSVFRSSVETSDPSEQHRYVAGTRSNSPLRNTPAPQHRHFQHQKSVCNRLATCLGECL